eukprot:202169_1
MDHYSCSDKIDKLIQFIQIPRLFVCSQTSSLTGHLQRLRNVLVLNAQNAIDDVDNIQVLDDYLYLMSNANGIKQFEYMFQYFGGECSINKCQMFARNYRDHSKVLDTFPIHYDKRYLCLRQILDKIHCYFFHSFDTGNMLTSQELSQLETIKTNAEEKTYCKHSYVSKLENILRSKKRNLFSTRLLSQKFIQMPAESPSKSYYHLGIKFKYDDSEYLSVTNRLASVTVSVSPKYALFKEELTTNSFVKLNLDQFNNEYHKALLHFATYHRKMFYPSIWIELILSIMIYCNYTQLQYKFSKTYRESKGSDHCEFYYLGKFLKQAVHYFGTKADDGTVTKFYHGVAEELLFSQYNDFGGGVRIFSPLSTTSELAVALSFSTGNNGMIIEFANICYYEHISKYFSCSWLSDYPNEREYLFVQCRGKLKIVNIINVKTCEEYASILSALDFIHNVFHQPFNFENKITTHQDELLVTKLFHDQLSILKNSCYKSFISLSGYGRHIVQTYWNKQTWLKMNYEKLCESQHRFLLELLGDNNCIKLDLIIVLFPNVNRITITNTVLSRQTFKNLLNYLTNQPDDRKLFKIILKNIDEIEGMSFSKAMNIFRTDFLRIKYKTENIAGHANCGTRAMHITYQPQMHFGNHSAKKLKKKRQRAWKNCKRKIR